MQTLVDHEALNLVNGRWVSGARHELRDPGRLERVVGYRHEADHETAAAAVAGAAAAASSWAATPLEDRIAALTTVGEELASTASEREWPQLLTSEQGKVLAESGLEIGRVPGMIALFADLVRSALAPEVLTDEKGRREVTYEPVGPVVAITPWNWPVVLSLGKVIPGLMAGNPMILKPAESTPLAVTDVIGKIAEALPPGILSIVHGGGEVGAALVTHDDVRKVVFTGSTTNGRRVYAAASGTVKNVTLELGGNDPAIVLDDIQLDDATVRSMLASAFVTSGQVCWAIKRVYVPRSRLSGLHDALADALDRSVVGHGLDPESTIGPLNNELQLRKIQALEAAATASRAKVTHLGAARYDVGEGYYHQPALVTDIDNGHELVQSEQFGPLLPLVAYDDLDWAVAAANDSEYGLCASVWSADVERAFNVARRLSAGQVFVNVHAGPALDYSHGIGGVRESGFGREYGIEGIRQYTEQRVLSNRVLR